MIQEIKYTKEVLEFLWTTSQDNSKNSYPKRASKDLWEKDIDDAIKSDSQKVIACYHGNIMSPKYVKCIYRMDRGDKYDSCLFYKTC
jgi:hypothetical protein